MYNEQIKKYGQTRKSVTETIRICINRNVLRDYLESKEQEVVDIMMTLFDDEQVLEAYTEDIKNREARKTAERMMKDELKKLEAEVMQLT